jgi:general stress protein 26
VNIEELKMINVGLMEKSKAVYLTTIDNKGYPCTRALINLRNKEQYPSFVELFGKHNNDFLIYFSTNTSSNKIVQIKANPKVSAYYCIPDNFHGMMLSGEIEIVADPEIKNMLWRDGWERYYPEGSDDPDYTVLRLKPNFARGWYNSAPFEFKLR